MQPKQPWRALPGRAQYNTSCRLRCLEAAAFPVTVAANTEICDLKELVHEEGINTAKRRKPAKDPEFLKVSDILESSRNTEAHFICFVRSSSH